MIRNDYRRALIMLRSLMNNYSGHARIEVRTLAGTLSVIASIPQGAQSVNAALVGSHRGKYFAAPLGTLRRDMRGQGVMTASIDPREINGRPLEQYSLLTLVEVKDGAQDVAMVGNLNGNVEVDWGKVRDAACALYRPEAQSVAELGDRYIERRQGTVIDKGQVQQAEIIEEIVEEIVETPEEEIVEERIIWEIEPQVEETPLEIAPEEVLPELPLIEPEPEPEPAPEPEPIAEVEPELEEAPPVQGEGWSFAKLRLPKGCGFRCAYIGARCPVGAPDLICYALPARYSPEPPPGLEDYDWVGDCNEGWWLKCCEPIEGS